MTYQTGGASVLDTMIGGAKVLLLPAGESEAPALSLTTAPTLTVTKASAPTMPATTTTETSNIVHIRPTAVLDTKAEARRKATIRFLSQVRDQVKYMGEIDELIALSRDRLTLNSPQLSDMPKAPSPNPQSMETGIIKVIDLEERFDAEHYELLLAKDTVNRMVVKVKDLMQRTLLYSYFVEMKTWKQTATILKIGKQGVYDLRNKALSAMEQILEQEGELKRWL